MFFRQFETERLARCVTFFFVVRWLSVSGLRGKETMAAPSTLLAGGLAVAACALLSIASALPQQTVTTYHGNLYPGALGTSVVGSAPKLILPDSSSSDERILTGSDDFLTAFSASGDVSTVTCLHKWSFVRVPQSFAVNFVLFLSLSCHFFISA